MLKKSVFSSIFLVLCLSGFEILAQSLKLPYKDVGACPFECCTYREWTANKDTVLRRNPADRSPIVFKLKKGEKAEGLTGIVLTTKPGTGTALKNTDLEHYDQRKNETSNVPIKKGERFFLLTYQGEDVYKVWFKGRVLYAKFGGSDLGKTSSPIAVWWVKIKNSKGRIGWTRSNENFDDMDACG